MTVRHLLRLPILVLLIGFSLEAHAVVFKDPQWQALLEAGRNEELERAAQARLKQQLDDVQAGVALALTAVDGADNKRMEAAVRSMQQCVSRLPDEAICHYALGTVMSAQALSGGMVKALSLTGKIKQALSRALELDAGFYEARSALQQFYLAVPSVAGGSIAKAQALEAEIRDSRPEQAKLLRARVAMQASNLAEAERELQGIKAGSDTALQADVRQAWGAMGYQFVKDKQFAKAKAWFEQLEREQPRQAMGAYGLGRVALASQQPEEAIRQFERARGMEGAAGLPLDYRQGIAYQDKGDKAQARAALERVVANRRSNPRNVEDARKRLVELG